MTARVRAGLTTIALVAIVALPACGDDTATFRGIPGKEIAVLDRVQLPRTNLQLDVAREKVEEPLAGAEPSYVDAMTVFSFRQTDVLQATLQVARIAPEAEKTPRFRDSFVQSIGASTPQQVRVGGDVVYLTTGTNQRLSVWFRDQYLYVLAVREDFLQPRTLLRQLLEYRP